MTRVPLPLRYNKYNRILINKIYYNATNTFQQYFAVMFRNYKSLYSFSSEKEAYEVIGSTYMTFMSAVLIAKCKNILSDTQNVLLDNFYFAMMYSLVDTLLDTKSENKVRNILSIRCILYEGKKDRDDPLIVALYEIYSHFSNRQEVIEAMKLAFQSEYKSYLVQYRESENCKEEDYSDVCEDIGYTMYNLFKAINNISGVEEYDRVIGYGGQLCDNITDIDDDISNNINTIATYVYQKEGKLDKLYYDMMSRISKMPENDEYAVIKYALTYGFYYVVNKCKYITEEIKREIKDYAFSPRTSDINKDAGKAIFELL